MTDEPDAPGEGVSLGQYLKSVRGDRELSLRDVEEKTGKQVSNAYLSQLENDRIKQPSPNILYALAELYRVDYGDLMQRSGYVTASKTKARRHGRVITFSDMYLSEAEESELLKYLSFLRSKAS
jgi:transcriptional regulator with XRE-family HTH domain